MGLFDKIFGKKETEQERLIREQGESMKREEAVKMSAQQSGGPLRVPIQDVYNIMGVGTIPVGRVEAGVLRVGMQVKVMPSGKVGTIKTIEMNHKKMQEAMPGNNVGFQIEGISKQDIARGSVVVEAASTVGAATQFNAKLTFLNDASLSEDSWVQLHMHTVSTRCKLGISGKFKKNQVVDTTVLCETPIFVDPSSPSMKVFALRDRGRTIAQGEVTSL